MSVQVTSHSPMSSLLLRPLNREPTVGLSPSSIHSVACNSRENRTGVPMSDTSAHTWSAVALIVVVTSVVGPSS